MAEQSALTRKVGGSNPPPEAMGLMQHGEGFLNRRGRRVVNVVSKLLTDTEHAIICAYGHCHNSFYYADLCNEDYERVMRVKDSISKGLYRQEDLF